MKSFLGNFYGHLAIFSGHTDVFTDLEEEVGGGEGLRGREREYRVLNHCNKRV